jgi:Co/Zn/Cd efflux system component
MKPDIENILLNKNWNIDYIDAIAAILSSFVIIKWSVGLLKDSGIVLLDINSSNHEHHL